MTGSSWATIALVGLVVVIIAVLSAAAAGLMPLELSVAVVGIITFFGVLGVAAFLSKDTALVKNEIRDAIAASFIVVYLTTVGWVFFGGVTVGDPVLLGHFSNLVGVLIAFYVGAKVAEVGITKYKEMSITNTFINKKGEMPPKESL